MTAGKAGGLAGAAVSVALLAGAAQPVRAQGAHAGHGPAPAGPASSGTTVNPGPLVGAGGAPSIAHTGHEALFGMVLIDELEYRRGTGGSDAAAWRGQAFYGGDYDKVRLYTRGEYSGAERSFEGAEVQLLYSRLIGYFFDAQIGVRQDIPIRPREGTPARTHLVVGIQGLLPNLFEVNVQGFVNHRGTVAARVEASYNIYVTQRLVLEPEIELEFAANADRPARVGKGLTSLETGLRLRYEITREFAPYVGVSYERAVGETAGLYRRFGERPEITSAVAGIRLFF